MSASSESEGEQLSSDAGDNQDETIISDEENSDSSDHDDSDSSDEDTAIETVKKSKSSTVEHPWNMKDSSKISAGIKAESPPSRVGKMLKNSKKSGLVKVESPPSRVALMLEKEKVKNLENSDKNINKSNELDKKCSKTIEDMKLLKSKPYNLEKSEEVSPSASEGKSHDQTADAEQNTCDTTLFSSLGLNDWIVQQCKAVGMKRPTPIQRNCIPPIVAGDDCIGCAKTGSGKTAAFALPVLQKLCEDPYGIFALVIAPTRELAFQVAEQFHVLGKPIGVKELVLTGGRDIIQQGIELARKPHIVIATPGRLADHITAGTNFSLKKIKFLIMDEADKLLEDDFGEDLKKIFDVLPKKRQTLLFSATMSETLKELAEIALNKPFTWFSKAQTATVEQLDQRYVLMPAEVKDAYMMYIINEFTEKKSSSAMIIFTNSCKYAQILGMICRDLGFDAVLLHSMITQRERLSSLARFKSHQAKILIATDVASRGLDIPSVDLIINHNIPNKPKDYIHRVGRTARAGRDGMAISLVSQFDVKLVHAIERHINTKMIEYPINDSAVAKILTEVAVSRREAEIFLDEQDFGEKKEVQKRKQMILQGLDPDEEKRKQLKRKKKKNKQKQERYMNKKAKKMTTSK